MTYPCNPGCDHYRLADGVCQLDDRENKPAPIGDDCSWAPPPRYKDLNDMQIIDEIIREVEQGYAVQGRCNAGWVAWHRLHTLRKGPPCSACAGTGKPISGLPCVCGGKGTMLEEMAGLRNELHAARLRAEAAEMIIERLLEILDSSYIRHCESLASVHGHSLDKETSERYGKAIKIAREILSRRK